MKRTRLFELLSSLNSSELLELKKMVNSPFFNKRKDVMQLFDYLNHCIKKGKTPTKNAAFDAMKSSKNFDDHAVRLPMSILKKLLEKYLVQKEIFSDKSFVEAKLATVLRKRKLTKQHEKVVKDGAKKLQEQPLRNTKTLEHQLDFQLEEFQRKVATRRTGELNLQALSDQLDNIFIAKKLRQVCLLLSHQRVYKKDYDFGLLEAIVKKVETENLHELPAIGMYYFAWKTLTEDSSDVHFQQFKKLVLEKADLFPDDEMRDLTILAINFCIQKYNQGNRDYLLEEFEIYKEGLERGYFLNDNQISRFTYRNIVTLSLVLKDYDWTDQFINHYKKYLNPKYRDSMFNFNLARLEYERKNYDHALDLLRQCEHEDLLLELSTRTMFLKIFYEMGSFDLLPFHISALQTFMRRKKIIAYHRNLYSNFTSFFTKMLNLPPGDRASKKELKNQIEVAEVLAEKEWLLRQL